MDRSCKAWAGLAFWTNLFCLFLPLRLDFSMNYGQALMPFDKIAFTIVICTIGTKNAKMHIANAGNILLSIEQPPN